MTQTVDLGKVKGQTIPRGSTKLFHTIWANSTAKTNRIMQFLLTMAGATYEYNVNRAHPENATYVGTTVFIRRLQIVETKIRIFYPNLAIKPQFRLQKKGIDRPRDTNNHDFWSLGLCKLRTIF